MAQPSAARAKRADAGIAETISRGRNAAPAVEGEPGTSDSADTGHQIVHFTCGRDRRYPPGGARALASNSVARALCSDFGENMSREQASIADEQAERLREVGELSPECFRQLAENVSDVFYILDLQSPRMMYVSPAYEKLWARPVGSLYDEPSSWLSVVHPEDQPWVGEAGSRERHLSWDMEYRVLRADGSVRWISDREIGR